MHTTFISRVYIDFALRAIKVAWGQPLKFAYAILTLVGHNFTPIVFRFSQTMHMGNTRSHEFFQCQRLKVKVKVIEWIFAQWWEIGHFHSTKVTKNCAISGLCSRKFISLFGQACCWKISNYMKIGQRSRSQWTERSKQTFANNFYSK